MEQREILEGLKSGRPYDFIANNYCKMDKTDLKDIILELLGQFDGNFYETVVNTLAENLVEYKSWEE
jgi:hypothetical protein